MTDPATTEAKPAKSPLITMLDLVLWAERDAERLETWDRVLRAEGKCLDRDQARDLALARSAARVLELLRAHREEFDEAVAMRKAAMEKRVAGRSARSSPAATARS